MRKNATLLALVAVALVMAACNKREAAVGALAADQTAGRAAPRAVSEKPATAPRLIVRNATMDVVVADTEKAVDRVTHSVESLGGYVVGSEVWREGESQRARFTLRVPSAKLSPALSAIRNASTRVEHETVASEDVTQEYVDLESQLKNLEATETELRELLVTVRRNVQKAADILEVHRQLVAIRGEIEVTKGRLLHLSASAAMSKIELNVVPDAITRPVAEEAWRPVVVAKDASRALLAALRRFGSAAIWIVVYFVPVGGIIVLAVAALAAVARRVRRRVA